jgi:hypothetical protein
MHIYDHMTAYLINCGGKNCLTTSSVLIGETHEYNARKAENHTFQMVPNTKWLDKNCTLQAAFTAMLSNLQISLSVSIQNLFPNNTWKMWSLPIQWHWECSKQIIIELSRPFKMISIQSQVICIFLHQFHIHSELVWKKGWELQWLTNQNLVQPGCMWEAVYLIYLMGWFDLMVDHSLTRCVWCIWYGMWNVIWTNCSQWYIMGCLWKAYVLHWTVYWYLYAIVYALLLKMLKMWTPIDVRLTVTLVSVFSVIWLLDNLTWLDLTFPWTSSNSLTLGSATVLGSVFCVDNTSSLASTTLKMT